MKLRALAVVIAVVAAVGCAAAPVPAASHPNLAGGGPLGYWTRSRLLGARPFRGLGYRQAPSPGQSADARPAAVALRVGALFLREAGSDHFCTASVVASPGRDLLITAAHCIHSGKAGSYLQDIVFIPDYRDGQAPFGIWTVKRLLVAPQWVSGSDPSLDVGFVTLEPHDGRNIEDVLSANQLGTDSGYQYLVRVTGYPASADAPITCVNWTSRQSTSQLRFECGGFTGGTSGSPWVTHFDPRTRSGTIVGVIGGYQEGGDTSAISYSSYLGAEVQRLYREAIADQASAAG
jgi:V8-like Glu-specific endopeptidase